MILHFEDVIIPERARGALVRGPGAAGSKLLLILALLLVQIVFDFQSARAQRRTLVEGYLLLLAVSEVVVRLLTHFLIIQRHPVDELIRVGVPQPHVGIGADQERHLLEPLDVLLVLCLLLVVDMIDPILDL